ncbi:MAG TPA: alanine--glyoxylate aminotransferase family protein [Ignavibacteriaceae bacterium]|nr:alanine--glyoxylate aminotransferase family protein [Ignavibacteriaceae bacterium]
MTSFIPPKRILMGPGPSNVHPRVLEAMARPTIGHLDPKFIELMDEIKELLKYAFQTKNEVTFAVSGPGSVGMETCLVNLVEAGAKVLVCINGVFGGRMKSIIERCGAEPVVVNMPWGRAIDPQLFEDTLKKVKGISVCAFVHAETSTGAKSDVKTLTEISHRHNCVVIADTVTSLGGIPLMIDEWNIDAAYSGSQKCLSCPPGLSPVTFNERAVELIKKRKTPVQSWFMDLNLILGYWSGTGKRAYHHTAPINSLYALHESLLLLKEEGIENSWKRHKTNGEKLVSELDKIGLKPFVTENERLPQLTSVSVPEGINEANVRTTLLNQYNIEIGAGLGELAGKVWRIGLMGYSSNEENIEACVNALSEILNDI